jgi:predicted transglutaminase-like cysteine proteinase
LAINRIMIAVLTFALAQTAVPAKPGSAFPFTSVSRLKNEVIVNPVPPQRQRTPAIEDRRAVPPLAFVSFCNRNKDQCTVRLGSLPMRNGTVIATPAVLSGLITVNTQVNSAIRKHSDNPRQDVWKMDVTAGDCEDSVLTNRAQLLAKGWPSSALLIAVVFTPNGKGHAVLVARTDAGDFVLDNLRSEMITREKSDYRFVSMQDGSRQLGWIAL